MDLFDDGETVREAPAEAAEFIDPGELGNSADNQPAARIQREQLAARQLPAALRLGYYDPARDYQSGEARAVVSEERGAEDQRELAAVLDAATAKALAQTMLGRTWAERDTLTLRLGPERLGLVPGSRIELGLSPRRWTVKRCTIDGFAVIAELKPTSSGTAAIAADAGRVSAIDDTVAGEVSLAVIDASLLGSPTAQPTILVAASTPTPGWRIMPVEARYGGQRIAAQTARRKAVIGASTNALAAADTAATDLTNTVDVSLLDPDQWLVSCDDEALREGANVALLRKEIIQFGQADPIGPGKFRLSRLARGLRGTEWAVSDHSIDDRFVLIEPNTLQTIPLPPWALGYEVSVICGEASASITVPGKPTPEAIAEPSGGATEDSEARAVIAEMLAAMREQGLIAS
jgi:hypothetical protein